MSSAPRSSVARGAPKSSVMRGSKAPPVSGTKASKKDSRHMTSKSGRYPASGGGPLEHPSGVPVVWVDGVDVTPRSLLPSLSAGVLKGAEVSESAQSEASLFDFKAPPEEGTKTPEHTRKAIEGLQNVETVNMALGH